MTRREARRRVDQLFEKLDLGDVADKFPAQISGGMQKRVALARALITQPQLILFDEPTTGLDPQRKNSVFTMIADYRRDFDFTAVMVCHDIPEALFVSDRVAWIDRGQVRFVGLPTDLEVATDPDLLEFVHHRNTLLSDVAGQQGRSTLFAQWQELRVKFSQFVVATCTTQRPRPGAELGLRRFASYQAAVAGVSSLRRPRSEIYFLDERHFGFAASADSERDLADELTACLGPANEAASANAAARYTWSARCHPLATLPDPSALWGVVEFPNTIAPFSLRSPHELAKD